MIQISTRFTHSGAVATAATRPASTTPATATERMVAGSMQRAWSVYFGGAGAGK